MKKLLIIPLLLTIIFQTSAKKKVAFNANMNIVSQEEALRLPGTADTSNTALSSAATVGLVTVSPGNELYNAFGHSAIVIEDKRRNIRKLYNYGVFDFNDPNFYTNFTRGKLRYMLAVEEPNDLLMMAQYESRSVYYQELNLTMQQKEKLYQFLEKNYLPENRFYKYDFFYDNCSSRLRDALTAACGDALIWALPDTNTESFRGLIDPYLRNQRYQDMGMDLGMGTPADAVATPSQMMFLPDYLKDFVGKSKLKVDGVEIPLVKSESTVLENPPFPDVPFWQKPGLLTGGILLLTLIVTFVQLKRPRAGHWYDVVLFSIGGLISILLIFLWFFTDHSVTKWNLNLLWANPILFWFIYLIIKKAYRRRITELFLIYFYATGFLLLFWVLWPQELNVYLAPIVASLFIRTLYIFYRFTIKIAA